MNSNNQSLQPQATAGHPLRFRIAVFLMFSLVANLAMAQSASSCSATDPASCGTVSAINAGSSVAANSSEPLEPEAWSVHGQFTSVTQKHASFTSPYAGPNSLLPKESAKETVDSTLFLGLRLWPGAEVYLNPELDQGFGLSDTLGLAGFSSGAAYKVGHDSAYGRLQRAFLRQTFSLAEGRSAVESGPNTLAGSKPDESLTLTVGKFSVVDIFDNNGLAHDPRADFLNWTVIDAGAFDYAADSWGYTYGMAAEWTLPDWTLRAGVFAMSSAPNSEAIDKSFVQREWVGELERRYAWGARKGTVRLLGFVNQARMASYSDALALALATGQTPDVNAVRRMNSKSGFAANLEQELASDLAAFARWSRSSGKAEAYDFTDVNQSLSAGLTVNGNYWNQPTHTFGSAFAVNGLSKEAKAYFAAGGAGLLIGDGQLPHCASEQILEAYYGVKLNKALSVTADLQYIRNPAYNADRGPVAIGGLRVHAEF